MDVQNQSQTTSPPSTSLRASLIISTWNGRPLLETCLPRVLQAVAQAGGNHEIIVVDDASTDDTVPFLRRAFPQIRLLALARNLRFAGANNTAARFAEGDILVFLNNDMLVAPDFLDPLLRPFVDPQVFAVTAYIQMEPSLRPSGLIRETGLVRARFENGFFALHHEDPESEAAVPVIYAGGGSSAWRRDRFLELGGFDTLFRPFYFEDLDVSYRGQKQGWKLLFAPGSRAEHKHQQTNTPANFPPGFVEMAFGKNNLLFIWKVVTDSRLLGQHFRALWRKLMRPQENPTLARTFRRAARQLPELLRKRHQARRGSVLTDHEVIACAQGEGREAGGGQASACPDIGDAAPAGRRQTEVCPPQILLRLLGKAFVLRRGTERWGFEVAEPPHRALVIRAGSLALVRQLLTEITARYPSAKLTVLAPEALAEETAREVNVSVISARGVEPVSYQIRRAVLHKLHAGRFDTVYVAGEGNRRAEALALLTGGRKVEVREDGAAHVFSLAPHKPILSLGKLLYHFVRAAALTALLGIVWGSIAVEGGVWKVREKSRETQ